MMAGHSRWKTLQAKRLAETGDIVEHPEYEQAGRDLRLGDQLRAIRRSRNLTQKEVAERAGISQPALSRIELGGGVPDLETLRRLGHAMGVRFHVIVGDEGAEQEETCCSPAKPRHHEPSADSRPPPAMRPGTPGASAATGAGAPR
jgi:DNA-binding XRE family transcriptional regulator